MTSEKFGTQKGYEFYSGVNRYIADHGMDQAATDFANLMPWGTPEEVLEKVAFIKDTIDINGILCAFVYGGMPYSEAERNLRCFVKNVLPELRKWDVAPLPEPEAFSRPTFAASAQEPFESVR
jgi:hypothetical protein